MLCFVKEDIAFWVLDRLFQSFFPDDFLKEDFLAKEKKLLIEIGLSLKIFNDFPIENHEKFIENCVEMFVKSLFVDILTFQTTYFIWDNMLSKGTVII